MAAAAAAADRRCWNMTLPLITRTLVGAGLGERAIGAVYGWNTLGSIVGVVFGGLLLLPLVGLKAMLVAGAGLDMAIGVLLLYRGERRQGSALRLTLAAAAGSLVVLGWAGLGVRLDRDLMISGVYRLGKLPVPGALETRFYRDGRTATVSIVRGAWISACSWLPTARPTRRSGPSGAGRATRCPSRRLSVAMPPPRR